MGMRFETFVAWGFKVRGRRFGLGSWGGARSAARHGRYRPIAHGD